MKKLALFIFFALALSESGARDLKHSALLEKTNISVGSKLYLDDGLTAGANDVLIRKSMVRLLYTRDEQTDICDNEYWNFTAVVRIYAESDSTDYQQDTLKISFGADGEYIYTSQALVKGYNHREMVVKVISLSAKYSLDGSTYTSLTGNDASSNLHIPADVDLEFSLLTEHYSYLDPTDKGYVHYDASSQEIRWLALDAAEEYDVEWVFIDKEDDQYSTISSGTDDAAFNYKEASRVRLEATSLFLPLVYPEGKLYFRVRPVGRFINNVNGDYTHVKTGSWGYDKSSTDGTNATYEVTTNNGFEDDKIWQYQVNYAEDGKNKRLITYYDGSLRQRQLVTNINSSDVSLVAETKYDYEGRPAVNVLPAPVSGFDLSYKSGFNPRNAALNVFDKSDFDRDAPTALYSPSSGTYGAAQYYSANNAFSTDPYRGIIPKSEGYPYTQTRYVDDNTGRVRSVSGVGPKHKIGSGHDTRLFYGTPTSTELERMFGRQVGKASHYKKSLTVDPNGQGSVSYEDQEGRTIATALIGDAPSNLESIAPAGETITVDLTDNNVKDVNTGEVILTHRFLNVATTNYDFTYSLDGSYFPITVNNPTGTGTQSICLDCKYELDISITDPNGSLVTLTQTSGSGTRITETYDVNTADCSSSGTVSFAAINFSATFSNTGEYVLSKKLRVVLDEDKLEAEVDSALSAMGINLDTMITNYQNSVDTTECDYLCSEHCLSKVLADNPTWTGATHQTEIDSAVAHCVQTFCGGQASASMTDTNAQGRTLECEALYEVMKLQVSPVGVWYESTNTGSGKTSFWTCIDAKVAAGDILLSDGTTAASTTDLRNPALWNDTWAALAVECHREYCHLLWCEALQESKAYDLELTQQADWTAAGSPNGYTDPLTTPNKDPFMDLTIDLSSSTVLLGNAHTGTGVTYYTIMNAKMADFDGNGNSLSTYVGNSSNTHLYNTGHPFNATNRWRAFMGMYMGLKTQLISELKALEGCAYYSDGDEVVKDPTFGPGQTASIQTQGSNFWGGGCEDLCKMNVASWMYTLDSVYNIYSNSADSTMAYDTLYDWCLNHPDGCGPDNPLGLITNSNYDSGNMAWVISTFSGMSMNITSILSSDYITDSCDTDSIGIITGASAFMIEAFKLASTELLPYSSSAEYFDIANGDVYPELYNNSITRMEFTNPSGTPRYELSFNTHNCKMALYDAAGNEVDLTNVDSLTNIGYDPHANPTDPGSLNYVHYMELSLDVHPSSGSVYKAYLWSFSGTYGYEGSNCYEEFAYDSIPCIPEMSGDSIPGNPVFDFDARRKDCVDFLMAAAQAQAEDQYNRYRDDIRNEILDGYLAQCLDNGQDETFYAQYELKEYHYTLYYLDQAGNLIQTVPPEGVELLGQSNFTNGALKVSATDPVHRLTTKYQYNSRNQVVQQQTPDAGITYFHYNRAGQLRYSQNASQANAGEFAYTLYDGQGRIIESGESSNTAASVSDFRTETEDADFPSAGWDITRTFYDAVAFSLGNASFISGQQNLRNRVASTAYIKATRGQTTKPASDKLTTASHYSYDYHGNVEELVQESRVMERTGSLLKHMRYDYDLISGNVNEVIYQEGHFDEFRHRYTYDGDNRITRAETGTDGYLWDIDGRYDYYLHGPLARAEVGEDRVQNTDHAYTLHGWLKSVNASTGRSDLDPGLDGHKDVSNVNSLNARDAFGYSIGYYYHSLYSNEKDYQPIASSHILNNYSNDMDLVASAGATKHYLYNGNIGHMTYALPKTGGKDVWMNTMVKAYKYDQLNRLSSMKTIQSETQTSDQVRENNSLLYSDGFGSAYSTDLTYDANGNILTLKRNGSDAELNMDSLSYVYDIDITTSELSSNRLRAVNDKTSNTSNYATDVDDQGSHIAGPVQSTDNYRYDEIGNLVKDVSEEIDTIDWNLQGKINFITRSSSSTKNDLSFFYGPDGNRVTKVVKDRPSGNPETASDWTLTHYVRDASGNIMATYKETFAAVSGESNEYKSTVELAEQPIYGSSRLGIYESGAKVNNYFSGISSTTGFADVTTTNASHSMSSGLSHQVQGNGSNITVIPSATDTILISALGDSIELGGTYTLVTGTLSYVNEAYYIAGNQQVSLSINNGNNITLNSNGIMELKGTEDFTLQSAGSIVVSTLENTGVLQHNDRVLEKKAYEFTDHLGNVLATTTDRKLGIEDTDSTSKLSDDFQDGLTSSWLPVYNTTVSASNRDLAVTSNSSASQVMKTVTLGTIGAGCNYKICLDVGSTSLELTLKLQDNTGKTLYSYLLTNGATNCFSNLIFTTDIRIVVEAGSTGSYALDNIELTEYCYTFLHYVADVTSARDYYPFGSLMPGGQGTYSAPCETELSTSNFSTTLSSYAGTLDWSSLATELNTEHDLNLTADEAEEILVESDLIQTDLEFDDAYLSVGTGNDYHVGASDFTVEFWAKLDATALNTYRPFVSNQKITGSDRSGINIMERNGIMHFHLNDGVGAAILNSATVLSTGQWYHIVLVRIGNDANDFKLYIDGVDVTLFVNTDNLSTGVLETSTVNPMSLSYTHDGGRLTDAHMTNVRIYKRAMAQAEAAANAGSALNATPSNSDQMIFYLPLDENTGTTPKELVKNTLGSISTSGTHSWNRVKNTSSGQSKTYTLQTTSNCNFTAEGRNFNAGGYRFGFNGKEQDNEVAGTGNQYDYGFRIYNARIAKFLSVDPLFKSFPYYTPYQFAGNMPIAAIDLDGLEEDIVVGDPPKTQPNLGLITAEEAARRQAEIDRALERKTSKGINPGKAVGQFVKFAGRAGGALIGMLFSGPDLGNSELEWIAEQEKIRAEMAEEMQKITTEAENFTDEDWANIRRRINAGNPTGNDLLHKDEAFRREASGDAAKGAGNWLKKVDDVCEIPFGCEKVADRVVKELGEGTQYLQITPKFGNQLGPVNGKNSGWNWHVAATKNGKVYDKLTGSQGMNLEDYKKLFDYSDDLNFDQADTRTLK